MTYIEIAIKWLKCIVSKDINPGGPFLKEIPVCELRACIVPEVMSVAG